MMPKPGAKVPSNTVIILYAESQQALSETRGNIEVPDLFGLSIREAEEELEKIGLKLKQGKGNGLIIDQRPRAGTKVKEGAEVIVNMTEGN
jgi:beta-lactam-binding protein with PASTA domain